MSLDALVWGFVAPDPPRFALRIGRLVPAGAGQCTLARTLQRRLAADPRSFMRHFESRRVFMDYKLHVVRVYVADWERALEFYTGTLEMPVLFAGADIGWAELDTGEAHLALERIDPGDPETAGLLGRFVSVSLRVENIRETYETLTARGVNFLAPPERQPWGGVLAHLCDLEGNVLTLVGS